MLLLIVTAKTGDLFELREPFLLQLETLYVPRETPSKVARVWLNYFWDRPLHTKTNMIFRFNILRSPTYAPSASLLRILAVKIYVKWANHVVCTDTKRAIFKLWEKFWIWRFTKSWADLGPPTGDIIGHVNKVPTMQFLTRISRNTHLKSYMLS